MGELKDSGWTNEDATIECPHCKEVFDVELNVEAETYVKYEASVQNK